MANALSQLTLAQLEKAVELRTQIETLENQLERVLGGAPAGRRARRSPGRPIGPRPGRPPGGGKKRTAAEIRARNAAYQRMRRAKLRAAGRPGN